MQCNVNSHASSRSSFTTPPFLYHSLAITGYAMQRDLIDILACPTDKAPLTLTVEHADGDDVVAGSLTCTMCNTAYPIRDSIPNLLPTNYPA